MICVSCVHDDVWTRSSRTWKQKTLHLINSSRQLKFLTDALTLLILYRYAQLFNLCASSGEDDWKVRDVGEFYLLNVTLSCYNVSEFYLLNVTLSCYNFSLPYCDVSLSWFSMSWYSAFPPFFFLSLHAFSLPRWVFRKARRCWTSWAEEWEKANWQRCVLSCLVLPCLLSPEPLTTKRTWRPASSSFVLVQVTEQDVLLWRIFIPPPVAPGKHKEALETWTRMVEERVNRKRSA